MLLIFPQGDKLPCALQFGFIMTNNDIEYEALIGGLEIANKLEVTNFSAFYDSKIIVNQVQGGYKDKDEKMRLYLTKVREITKPFNHFNITRVLRSRNTCANMLNKLTTEFTSQLNWRVIIEEMLSSSVNQANAFVGEFK